VNLPKPILDEKVITIARRLDPERARALAEALITGGLSVIEITMEGDDGPASIAALRDIRMTVGAGTVMTVDQAATAVDAGAGFLVSPHLDPVLVEWARANQIPYLPGVFTPTEAAQAVTLGVDTVKLFPASLGGPGLVTALSGPLPNLAFIPAGGIDASNAASFLNVGCPAVGVGGWLTSHSDLTLVTARAQQLVRVV
jgi:2-dehydro-3-deoxyphosphogluconate aldolase/(4S)-4-hydroxy-2-oxoglutarate aldolase